MTETDNKTVAKHIELPLDNARKWLLRRLSELDDDERDADEHFVSREIKPVVLVGQYDGRTGKYYNVRPTASTTAMSIAVDATSAAVHAFTVTDGQTWEIYGMSSRNGTRSAYMLFFYSPDAGTTRYGVPGTSAVGATGTAHSAHQIAFPNPLVVTGSSTNIQLGVNDMSFTASDVRQTTLWYRRIA